MILGLILPVKKGSTFMIMSYSSEIFLDRVSRWKRVSADSYLLSLCSDGLHGKGVYITHIVVVLL